MKSFFENERTNELFYRWISNYPESFSRMDNERFYEFIINLTANGGNLTESILNNAFVLEKEWQKEYREEQVELFIDKYLIIRDFYDYLLKTCP